MAHKEYTMPFNVRLGKRHEMRVKLYPNNLEGVEGKYIARTSNEAKLTREDILASMRERGDFAGNAEDFLANFNRFFDEVEYQACDGFAVNIGPATLFGYDPFFRRGKPPESLPCNFL
jgi:hypothetical protein